MRGTGTGAWSGARANYPSAPRSANLVKSDHFSNCTLLFLFRKRLTPVFGPVISTAPQACQQATLCLFAMHRLDVRFGS